VGGYAAHAFKPTLLSDLRRRVERVGGKPAHAAKSCLPFAAVRASVPPLFFARVAKLQNYPDSIDSDKRQEQNL
jgi:hypothetical protein